MICQLYFFFTKWKSPYYIECVCQVVRKIFILLNNYLCISLNMNHILFWPGGQCVYCRVFFFTKADSVIKELKVKNISLVRAIGNQYNEYYCHMPLKNSLITERRFQLLLDPSFSDKKQCHHDWWVKFKNQPFCVFLCVFSLLFPFYQ